MKLIVGLGNPDKKYKKTRHNVGFIFVDGMAEKYCIEFKHEKKFKSDVAQGFDFILAKPQTYMNNSGVAVSKLVSFYKTDLNDLVVIHDDVDMEIGKARFKKGMGTAGHHGVEDITNKLGSKEFWRLRIGVGRPAENRYEVEDFVLGKLSKEQIEAVKTIDIEL